MKDVIIIGMGPAGVSAALYAKRAGLDTIIIGNENSALEKTDKIENYYGLNKIISGKELIDIGINQAKNIDVELAFEEVLAIEMENNFKVITTNNNYETKAVIIATGANRKKPKIKGIKEFEGKGVNYCAICDAFFYRGKNVGVLGNGEYALHEAEQLKNVVNSITLLTNGEPEIEKRSNEYNINVTEIKEIVGDNKVKEVRFVDDTKLEIDGIFVAEGVASSLDLAKKIGIQVKDNNIVINENMQTNIPGIYAAGDCTGGLLQIAKAVYEGAKAGMEVIKFCKNRRDI